MTYPRLVSLATLAAVLLFGLPLGAAVITNGGFETGSLPPWFQDRTFCSTNCVNWAVTNTDSHTGAFSALDSGNIELRQNFAAVSTSLITEVSFWMKHPNGAGTPLAYTFFYSDATSAEFGVSSTDAGWDFVNATANLAVGKNLVGFSVFGVDGPADKRTFIDDVQILTGEAAVPEPGSLALVGSSLLLIAAARRRIRK